MREGVGMKPSPRLDSPGRAAHPRRGFTLIELLAVIAITGVLVALVLATLGPMRANARQARCASNLRVVAQAFPLYAADNQGYIPAARYHATQSDPTKGRRNPSNSHWETELKPYIGTNIRTEGGKESAFAICPDGKTGMYTYLVYRADFTTSGYSLDYQVKFAEITIPSRRFLVGDSDDYHMGVWNGMTPDEETGLFTSGDPIRHREKANYLFVDGHVETLALAQAVVVANRGKSSTQ